jgi:hypothetical protein
MMTCIMYKSVTNSMVVLLAIRLNSSRNDEHASSQHAGMRLCDAVKSLKKIAIIKNLLKELLSRPN